MTDKGAIQSNGVVTQGVSLLLNNIKDIDFGLKNKNYPLLLRSMRIILITIKPKDRDKELLKKITTELTIIENTRSLSTIKQHTESMENDYWTYREKIMDILWNGKYLDFAFGTPFLDLSGGKKSE